MANGMYTVAKNNMESGAFNWTDGLWYACLVSSSYTPSLSGDTTKAAFSADIIGTPVNLSGNAVSAGVLSANDPVFTGIASSTVITYVVVYHDNGSGATFPAFLYDTGTGLPYTATGTPITVYWNNVTTAGPLMTL